MILLSLFLISLQARANDLALPENFFKNSGIRSTQFVRRIDICTRVKGAKQIFLVNQWDGSNRVPASEQVLTTKKGKKKKAKKVRSRGKRKSPESKSQVEVESVILQLTRDKDVDTVIMENCAYPLAVKFKERATLLCEETVTDRFDFLIASVKKSTSEKPILAVYEEQHSDEFMKRFESEKWNCEVYEPKSFKVKKAKRKLHAKEVIEMDIEDEHEE